MEPSEKFFTPDKLAFLQEHGWVVIDGVATQEECNKMVANIQQFFQLWDARLKPGSSPDLWMTSKLPPGGIHGIVRATGHIQAQWDARQHPNVHRCYAEYWKDQDLRVSFDAFNFIRAGSAKESRTWRHSDQGPPTRKPVVFLDGTSTTTPLEGRCLQGYLCLIDSTGENDGGLLLSDKGHRTHAEFFRRNPQYADNGGADGNWVRFTKEHLLENGGPPDFIDTIEKDGREWLSPSDPEKNAPYPVPMRTTRIGAKAGSMVFWYSRTPHESSPPTPQGKDRAVVYVCMAPAKWLTKADILRRKKAWEEKRQTSHWPCGGQTKFLGPRFYPDDYKVRKPKLDEMTKDPLLKSPLITPLGAKLIGLDDYKKIPEAPQGRARSAKRKDLPGVGSISAFMKKAAKSSK